MEDWVVPINKGMFRIIPLFLFSNNLDDSFTSKIYDLEIASIFSLSGIQIYFLYEIILILILK